MTLALLIARLIMAFMVVRWVSRLIPGLRPAAPMGRTGKRRPGRYDAGDAKVVDAVFEEVGPESGDNKRSGT